jgi:hypothetical protein
MSLSSGEKQPPDLANSPPERGGSGRSFADLFIAESAAAEGTDDGLGPVGLPRPDLGLTDPSRSAEPTEEASPLSLGPTTALPNDLEVTEDSPADSTGSEPLSATSVKHLIELDEPMLNPEIEEEAVRWPLLERLPELPALQEDD